MSRKTHKFGVAALVVAAGLIFASTENGGAFAQNAPAQDAQAASGEADGIRFISQEVVQEVPEKPEGQAEKTTAPSGSLKQLIAETDSTQKLSEQMKCLAGAVYFESRGEPLAGQLAVAQVIINRAESKQFPADYCGVVRQRAQFSFVKHGRMPAIRTGSEAWDRAKAIAVIAHEGLWNSKASDALYFHAKYVRPRWSRRKARLAKIANHIFYR